MVENNTGAARIHKAVIFKRMPDHYSWNQQADGTFTPASPHSEFETAMGTWVVNLEAAQEQDFMFMWRDGVLANAATVLGAERIPVRFVEGDEASRGRVRMITSLAVPGWVESLIGQEFDMPQRNPVFYIGLRHDPLTGDVEIKR